MLSFARKTTMKHLTLLPALLLAACGPNSSRTAAPASNAPPAAAASSAPSASSRPIAWEFTESLNGAADHVKVDAGRIELTAGAETDFFIEPGQTPYEKANAPLLLRVVDNTKPFTFSVAATPVHSVKYDAGMAFLYVSEKQWVKFAFEADERMKTRIVTVRTREVSDDNNHDVVSSPTVHLKISSDTRVVGFYYSVDGTAWQLVRVFKNDFPPVLRVGIGTQSPAGQGNRTVFEKPTLVPESVKDFRMGL